MSNKVWLSPNQKGKVKARVDGKAIPYGKDEAISLTDSQVERLKASDVPIQVESGGESGSKSKDSKSSDSGGK